MIRWYGESYLIFSLVPETQTRRSLLEAFTVVRSRLVGFELHDAARVIGAYACASACAYASASASL